VRHPNWWIPGLVLGVACAGVATTSSQRTPAFRAETYRTVALGSAPDAEDATPDLLRSQLRSLGYRWVEPEDADLRLGWAFGRASDRRLSFGPDTWVIEATERESGEVVWRGYAREARPAEPARFRRLVQEVLLGFPRAASRPVAY
jgi:hypothetical protein